MKKEKEKVRVDSTPKGFHKAVPIILLALAVFIGICYITSGDTGMLGHAISSVFLGLFSVGAYFIPFLIAIHALFYYSDIKEKRVLSRVIFSILTVIAVSALTHVIIGWNDPAPVFDAGKFYTDGTMLSGGGFIGGIIAFGITSLFGKVGVIIITAVIFTVYVIYFFSKTDTLVKIGRAIIYGLLTVCAFFEKLFKKFIGLFKKDKKRLKGEQERIDEFADDEFFDVDNGLSRLEISELGIVESRSEEAVEANPTLHEQVHHRSEADNDELRARRLVRDITLDEDEAIVEDVRVADAVEVEPDLFSDSADAIFKGDFDPYNIAMSERMANKPSTMGAAATTYRAATVTETIDEIDPRELERIRREAEFERAKERAEAEAERERLIKEARMRAYTEAPYHSPDGGKSVAFNVREEATVDTAPSESEAVSITVEKTGDGVYHEVTYDYREVESEEGRVSYTRPREEAPVYRSESVLREELRSAAAEARESEYITRPVEPERAPEHITAQAVTERAPEAQATYIPEEPRREYASESYTRVEPTPEEAREEDIRGFSLEFGDGISESGAGITVERTPIVDEVREEPKSFIFDVDEPEDDEDEDVIPEPVIEEEPDTEEIPPEEQNQDVLDWRRRFEMFRREDEAMGIDKDEEAPELSESVTSPYGKDEDEDVEVEEIDEDIVDIFEEDDEPPFEPIAREPKPEPKREKKGNPFKNYQLPPLDLLGLPDADEDDEAEANAEISENISILIETLASFGVTASIRAVERGPRITRYEVVPAKGVRVNQITNLFNDITLALATEGVRMEAPIPGKAAIGFEVPNKKSVIVKLRELLETPEYSSSRSSTFVCVGKDVAGTPVFGDIEKYPHALVAGATNMGKSVCINSIILSMLYHAKPNELRFILIDPKKVEFKVYSGIPHLLVPVVTESKQAAGALMWAVDEMERRYNLMEEHNAKNIKEYNAMVAENPSIGEPAARIIIVIDELNDLMMQVRNPVESLIMRLAQKARAAGIHLIIGTQRPDVKVITGTIKANIPTRISCKVTSQVDSRTILEQIGAEKLLPYGDILYKPPEKTSPVRVQGAYVSGSEVEAIVKFIKSQVDGECYDESVLSEINKAAQKCGNKKGDSVDDFDDDGDEEECGYYSDQQFLDAVEVAIRSRKVSTSLLQRKLKIGFSKAARYVDAMEEIGIVSEPNGQKPRDVLVTMDEWMEKLSRVNIDD